MIGPYLFHIGSFGVPAMGVCVLVGAVLAVLLSWILRKRTALDWNGEFVDAIIYAVLLGFVGMKLLYWFVTPGVFKAAFSNGFFKGFLSLLMEGMVFYGGLIGGIIGIFLVARKKKKNVLEFTDLFAPCFCVAHAFGRVGCLLAGCCYGVQIGETTQFGLLTYKGALAVKYLDGAMRLPVPFMETVFLLVLCEVLVLVFCTEKRLGTTTGWYLIAYAVWRFVIEMFRGDAERGKFGALYTSQWISILILLAGVAILLLARRFNWKKGKPFKVFREEDLTVPEPEEAAEEIAEEASAEAEDAAAEAIEEAGKAEEAAAEAEEIIEETAEEATEEAMETAEEAVEEAEEIAEETVGEAAETAEETVEKTEEAAEDAAEAANDTIANWVKETLGD
ncbi:MAG: prolipoprotein diacylglyceryl transferase [Clostridia bacterium]|nr:prolipoprotein diacylglyceryl transferase [Clostridia bacterium]